MDAASCLPVNTLRLSPYLFIFLNVCLFIYVLRYIITAIQDRKIAHTVDYEQILAPGATITLPGYEGVGQGGDNKAYKKKNKKRTSKGGQGPSSSSSSGSAKAEKRPRK